MNPFTKLSHASKYREMLEVRKKLPVFAHLDGFYKMVHGICVLISSRMNLFFSWFSSAKIRS